MDDEEALINDEDVDDSDDMEGKVDSTVESLKMYSHHCLVFS